MSTRKRFWDDPYLTHLDTTVLAVDGQRVQVRETILFAFSGGQESDSGTLGGYPVPEKASVVVERRCCINPAATC